MLIITVLLKQLKNFITSGDNPLTLMQLPRGNGHKSV